MRHSNWTRKLCNAIPQLSQDRIIAPRNSFLNLAAAARRPRLNALTLPNLHCWLVVHRCCTHALLDLAGHGEEGLFNVVCVLRGCLEKWDAEAVGKFLKPCISPLAFEHGQWSREVPNFGALLLPQCSPQLSCLPYRTYCLLGACSHLL